MARRGGRRGSHCLSGDGGCLEEGVINNQGETNPPLATCRCSSPWHASSQAFGKQPQDSLQLHRERAGTANGIILVWINVAQEHPALGAGCVSAGACGAVGTQHRRCKGTDFATADSGSCFSLM